MIINELIKELQKQVNKGYGNKNIFVEDGEQKLHIDSIQINCHPSKDPDYLFIMGGESVENYE